MLVCIVLQPAERPPKNVITSLKTREKKLINHLGGVAEMAGVAAAEVLLAGFGVALPLPLCEERLPDCCAACIFLRSALRRDLAPSMTGRVLLANLCQREGVSNLRLMTV